MKKIFTSLAAFVISLTLNINAFAEPASEPKLVGLPDPALIIKVEDYLNSIKTLQANFRQEVLGAKPASGRFFLQRGNKKGGKFRWEYLQGQQILIISNGSQIVYYDKKLDEVTYIPMQYGLASFLAEPNIKLSGKIKLLNITEDDKHIRAIVTQANKPQEGKLAMYFTKNPMQLSSMEVIDENKNITFVQFTNQQHNISLANDYFVFKDPKFYKNVWEKKKK